MIVTSEKNLPRVKQILDKFQRNYVIGWYRGIPVKSEMHLKLIKKFFGDK